MAEFGFVINTVIVVVVSCHLAVETLHWVCVTYSLIPRLSSVCMYMYTIIASGGRQINIRNAHQGETLGMRLGYILYYTVHVCIHHVYYMYTC